MSEQTIQGKAQIIRTETSLYGNTKERVADVLDDINDTKANKSDLEGITVEAIDDINKSIEKKLDKTIESADSPDETFRYVYILNEDNNAKRMLAGDLGKNVANSSLTSVANAGLTLGANWSLNTSSFYYYVKGLPDKSSDVNFTRFRVQDSNGLEAFAGNIYNALYSSVSQFSQQQSLNIAQLLNGGSGSSGAMSVNLISPPIVQNKYDSGEYILLQGANLNLSSVSSKIEILESDKTTVKAQIPNNQIQIYANGLTLIFYYNFYNFTKGQYFIKITSGSKVYITTLDLKVVQEVENINIGGITWNLLKAENVPVNNIDLFNGGNVRLSSSSVGNAAVINKSLKSSELFQSGENFYVELKFSISTNHTNAVNTITSSVGIGYSNVDNILSNVNLLNLYWSWHGGAVGGYRIYLEGNSALYYDAPISKTIIIIKTGNLFRMIMDGNNVIKTLNDSSGYSLFLQNVPRAEDSPFELQIVKAFKFN